MSTASKDLAVELFVRARTSPARGWFNVCDGCMMATHLTNGGCVVMEEGDPIPTLLCNLCKEYMIVMTPERRAKNKSFAMDGFCRMSNEHFNEIRQEDPAISYRNARYLRMHSFGVSVIKARILSRYDIPDGMLTIKGWATFLMENPTLATFAMPTCEINLADGMPTWSNQMLERVRTLGHTGEAQYNQTKPVLVGCSSCKAIGLVSEYITCPRCNRIEYCSKACKEEGWASHKEQCEPFCSIYKPISSSSVQTD